jgi:hypothetical protein
MSNKPIDGQKAIGLNELGWRCVHDTHYSPALNSDALPLFKLFPKLYQKHGSSTWCTAPGLAALSAFRSMVNDNASPRQAAAAIGATFSEVALIALADGAEPNEAANMIRTASQPELQSILDALAYIKE